MNSGNIYIGAKKVAKQDCIVKEAVTSGPVGTSNFSATDQAQDKQQAPIWWSQRAYSATTEKSERQA